MLKRLFLASNPTSSSLSFFRIKFFKFNFIKSNLISLYAKFHIVFLRPIPEVPLLNSLLMFENLIDSFSSWIENTKFQSGSRDGILFFMNESYQFFSGFIRNLCILFSHRIVWRNAKRIFNNYEKSY